MSEGDVVVLVHAVRGQRARAAIAGRRELQFVDVILLGALIVFAQGSSLAPFIYTLF
jgi:hypothetical protein